MLNGRPKALQAAIVAAFTPIASEELACTLGGYSARDWRGLGNWPHASGLALYFLDELKFRGIANALPADLLQGFLWNQVDNRERTAALAREFVSLNSQFASLNLDYLCVKGFSLGTAYCKDMTLRSQFDLDFWVREDLAPECGD